MAEMTREEKVAAAKAKWLKSLSREEKIALAQEKFKSTQPQGVPAEELLETGIRGALSSATLGLSEPVISGLSSLAGAAVERLPVGPDMEEILPGVKVQEAPKTPIAELYQQDIARRERLKREAPEAELAGAIAGAISPVGPAASAFKGAQALGKGAATALRAPEILAGAAGAGLGAGVTQSAERAMKEAAGLDIEAEPGALESAKGAAALSAGLSTLGALGKAAPKAAKGLMSAVFGVKGSTVQGFLDKSSEVLNAKKAEEIDEIARQAVGKVKQEATQAGLDLTDEIQLGLANLKKAVIQQSDISLQALEESGARFKRADIEKAFKEATRPMERTGMIGPAAQQAKEKTLGFIKDIQALPEEVDALTLKNIIRSIDDNVEFLQTPGTFTKSRSQQVLIDARRKLDDIIKTAVPKYSEEVSKVKNLSQLLESTAEIAGGEQKAFGAISKLGKPNRPIENQVLGKFFQQAQIDPERFRQAQENARIFNTWNEATTVDAKIKALMGAKSNTVKRQWEKLSQLSDTDFVREIEAMKIANEFEQEFLRGSRNVNLWTIIGATSGAGIGGGFLGGAGGAAIGAIIDKHGPKMAQKVLEQVVSIQGLPTVKKIMSLEIPEPIKAELRDSFIRSVVQGQESDRPVRVDPDLQASIGQEIKESQLSSVEKAKRLTQLNKTGEISGLRSLVVGKELDLKGKPTAQSVIRLSEPKRQKEIQADRPDVLKKLTAPKQPQGL